LKRPSILKMMWYLPVVYKKSTFNSTVLIIVVAIKTNPLCFLQNNRTLPCWQWFLSWGETTASKRTIVSCSRRPDSRTNTLNSQPVKQTPRKNVYACVNLTCNSIANLMRICPERFRRLKMAVKRSDFIVRLYSQISSAKINMSF
jgi:hypothetical protein